MKKSILLIRKFKLIIVTSLLSALSFNSYAQELIPVSPNPDTWTFMRYGGTSSINHFNGEVGVSIPIYTYEDPDFRIPISLSYGSGGWMAEIEAGIVGKNWTLNLGGLVSRVVRGLPDEKTLEVPEYIAELLPLPYRTQKHTYHGYMRAHQAQSSLVGDFSTANAYPHIYPIIGNGWAQVIPSAPYNSPIKVGEFIETTPDLFTFRFGDHYGSFMLQPNGKINTFNLSQPDVNYKIKYVASTHGGTIEITTGDGYTYVFGASYLSKLDYITMDGEPNQERPLPGDTEYNLTWPLTQIISPNGRHIFFEYDIVVKKRIIGVLGAYIERAYYLDDYSLSKDIAHCVESDFHMPNSGTQISSILRKVLIADTSTILLDYTQDGNWLKSITIKSIIGDNVSPQIFRFGYNETKPDKYQCFLKTIECPSGTQYKLDYYYVPADYNFQNIDKWGLNLFEPIVGMLKQITYPSGGYTTFGYEPHNYTRYVIRDSLINYSGFASGARISRITDYFSPSDSVWRSYSYSGGLLKGYPIEITDPGKTGHLKFVHQHKVDDMIHFDYLDYMEYVRSIGGQEPWQSGIIYQSGYIEWRKHRNGWGGIRGKLIDRESYIVNEKIIKHATNYTYTDRHVEYPLVTEHFSDGSKIEYKFSSFTDHPDFIDESYFSVPIYRTHYMMNTNALWAENMFYWCKYYSTPTNSGYNYERRWCDVNDRSALRRALKSMKVYAANSSTPTLHREFEYNFCEVNNETGSKKGLYNIIPTHVPAWVQYPTKTKTTEYLDSGTITSEIITEYGDKLKKVSTRQSNGKTTIVEYYYPENFSTMQIYKDMISLNMQNTPVRIVTSIKESDSATPYITGAIENVYSKLNSRIYMTETKQTNISNPVSSTGFNINSYLTDGIKLRYCNSGRIIEVTDQNNVKTTVIWGYKKTYVIAELKNCSFEEVQAAFTYSNLDTFSNKQSYSSNDWNALNALRSSSYLKKAAITTYEHLPLAGIVKMTDPSGRSVKYNYDEYNRLIEVLNDSNSKLETYQYNIGQ